MIRVIKSSGEIAIATLITLGVAIGGSYIFTFERAGALSDKVENQGHQIATLEEQSRQTQKTLDEMRSDIKEILKRTQ